MKNYQSSTQCKMFRVYKPDFILNNGIIVEAKGWFKPTDRVKHLLVQEQYPDLDIRFYFKTLTTRYTKTLIHVIVIGVTNMVLSGQTRRYLKNG